MLTLVAFLAGGLAVLALAVGISQVARKLGELEGAARQAPDAPGPTPSRRASGGRPMLSALYQESAPTPLESVSRLPGGRWLMGASVLAVAAMLIAATERHEGRIPPAALPDTTVVALARRVDSLAAGITVLRDSIRVLTVDRTSPRSTAPAPAATAKIARRSSPRVDEIVPAAPVSPFSAAP